MAAKIQSYHAFFTLEHQIECKNSLEELILKPRQMYKLRRV